MLKAGSAVHQEAGSLPTDNAQTEDFLRGASRVSTRQQQHQPDRENKQSVMQQQQQQQQQQQAEETVSSSQNALQILRQLQLLPWRRIDVSFQHSSMPFFAHNHIQVTRKWLNWEGATVCEHLAQRIADMEKDDCLQDFIRAQNT